MSAPELRPEELTKALGQAGVEYVLIGGLAVGLHGFIRTTRDIDLLIKGDERNRERFLDALRPLLVDQSHLTRLESWVKRGENVVRLPTKFGLVDVLEEGDTPLDWASVIEDSELRETSAGEIRVCGLRTLVALKRLAGRPQDQQDLVQLELAHGRLPDPDA